LRLDPDAADPLERDPVLFGWHTINISAIADDPFWLGDWVDVKWGDGEVRNFFSDAPGYLFWISPSQTFGSASISNPGDEATWPVWEITAAGGTLAGTITVDGGVVGFPAIPNGKTLIIDTHPATGYADLGTIAGGVFAAESEADGGLAPYDARPIPPGVSVPIGFDLDGSTSVRCRIRSRYWLAIGQ